MSRHYNDFGWFMGCGPFGGGRGRRRRRRWFEAGDMKYVILKMLQDKPKHGYEIMKDLEEWCGGAYQPSPGTVYPTLQWLEDEGLARARDVGGKKVYEITDEGEQFLTDHSDRVDDIVDRVRETMERVMGGSNPDVHRALGRLVGTVYRVAWRTRDDEVRDQIADRLSSLAEELEELVKT